MEERELRSGRRGWRTRIGLDLGTRFLAQVMPVKRLARVITAHRVCAFLLAIATTAFCQPERSFKASTHFEIGSARVCAVLTTDLAPWISKVRR